jgi:hypothetical protein
MAEEQRKANEARRAAEEQARIAQQAANESASLPEYAPRIEVAKVEKPVARGDLGARVGGRTVWKHEIQSVRQIPDRILKNQRVLDAISQVIGAEIRAGAREIKGVRIWDETEASIR